MRYWTDNTLLVTVHGPDGETQRAVDKPFARVGSLASSEVVLEHPSIRKRALYLHATGLGEVYFFHLEENYPVNPIKGLLLAGESVAIGPFRIAVEVLKSKHAGLDSRPLIAGDSPHTQFSASYGGQRLTTRKLRYPFNIVGRLRPSNIRIKHSQVSICHCVLYRLQDELWIVDLLSSNGSHLNGQLVECAQVPDGSALRLGEVILRFENGSGEGEHGVSLVSEDTTASGHVDATGQRSASPDGMHHELSLTSDLYAMSSGTQLVLPPLDGSAEEDEGSSSGSLTELVSPEPETGEDLGKEKPSEKQAILTANDRTENRPANRPSVTKTPNADRLEAAPKQPRTLVQPEKRLQSENQRHELQEILDELAVIDKDWRRDRLAWDKERNQYRAEMKAREAQIAALSAQAKDQTELAKLTEEFQKREHDWERERRRLEQELTQKAAESCKQLNEQADAFRTTEENWFKKRAAWDEERKRQLAELDSHKAEVADLEARHKTQQEAIARERKRWQAESRQLETVAGAASEVQAELANMAEVLQRREREWETERQRFEQELAQKAAEQASLLAQSRAQHDNETLLQAQCNELEEQLAALRASEKSWSKGQATWDEQRKRQLAELETQKAAAADLEARLITEQEAIADERQQWRAERRQLDAAGAKMAKDLQNREREWEKERRRLEQELKQLTVEQATLIAECQAQRDNETLLLESRKQLETQVDAFRATEENWFKKCAAWDEERKRQLAELDSHKAEVADLEARHKTQQESIAQERKRWQAERRQLETLAGAESEVQAELANMAELLQRGERKWETEQRKLEKELKQQAAEQATLITQSQAQKDNETLLQTRCNELEEQVAAFRAREEDWIKERADWAEQHKRQLAEREVQASLSEKLQTQQENVTLLSTRCSELEEHVAAFRTKEAVWMQERNRRLTELDSHKTAIADLEAMVKAQQEAIAQERQQWQAERSQLETAANRAIELEADLQQGDQEWSTEPQRLERGLVQTEKLDAQHANAVSLKDHGRDVESEVELFEKGQGYPVVFDTAAPESDSIFDVDVERAQIAAKAERGIVLPEGSEFRPPGKETFNIDQEPLQQDDDTFDHMLDRLVSLDRDPHSRRWLFWVASGAILVAVVGGVAIAWPYLPLFDH